MGKGQSVPATFPKDYKHVEQESPGSSKFLKKKKWVERYAFSGRLNTYDLTKLQEKIKNKHKANEKGLYKDGY